MYARTCLIPGVSRNQIVLPCVVTGQVFFALLQRPAFSSALVGKHISADGTDGTERRAQRPQRSYIIGLESATQQCPGSNTGSSTQYRAERCLRNHAHAFMPVGVLIQLFKKIVPTILGIVLFSIVRHVAPMYSVLQSTVDKLNGTVEENVRAIRTVKAFVREEREEEKFGTVNVNLQSIATRTNRMAVLNMPFFQLMMYICVLCLMYFCRLCICPDG